MRRNDTALSDVMRIFAQTSTELYWPLLPTSVSNLYETTELQST